MALKKLNALAGMVEDSHKKAVMAKEKSKDAAKGAITAKGPKPPQGPQVDPDADEKSGKMPVPPKAKR